MGKGYHNLTPNQPLPSRGWHILKLILRILSLLLCLAAVGLEVPTAIQYRSEAARLGLDYNAAVEIGITIGPPVVIILWDVAEFVTLCVRKGKRQGIPPGLHVAVELIFWLACGVLTALTARVAWVAQDNADAIRKLVGAAISGEDDGVGDEGDGVVGYADLAVFEGFALKTKIAAALFGLLTITRFTLFVRACVETHRRRKAKRRGSNPVIVTTQHGDSEALVPLTAYQPVMSLPNSPQYFDYAKPAAQVNVHAHPAFHQQARY